MLLELRIENYRSFKEEVVFSMEAGRQKKLRERVPKVGKRKVLPIAALYGANASGKSNLVDAIKFAQHFISGGTHKPDEPIDTRLFKLDPSYKDRPSRFAFTILVDDTVYEYGFAATRFEVVGEWLKEIKPASEKPIFHRERQKISLDGAFDDETEKLNVFKETTRKNLLFLTNTALNDIHAFDAVFQWFAETLTVLSPSSYYTRLAADVLNQQPLAEFVSRMLRELDTGVSGLAVEKIDIKLPNDFPQVVRRLMISGKTIDILPGGDDSIFMHSYTHHLDLNGEAVAFEREDESDGTLRLIDILPMFHELTHGDAHKVFIIDEYDRSLHTSLCQALVSSYLNRVDVDFRSQLILTTHNVLLMDQDTLRRDEMWIVERDRNGASALICLDDYEGLRSDKDIQKSYLRGYFGGIPRILMAGSLFEKCGE